MRRRALSAIASLGLSVLVLTACTSGTTDSEPAGQSATPSPPDPAPTVAVASSDAGEADDPVLVDAGQKLELTVDGGEFTEVLLTDADHPTVPTDTGTFAHGTASTTGDEPVSEDGPDVDLDDAGQAMAGGTTEPTHSLFDAEGDEEDDTGETSDAEESAAPDTSDDDGDAATGGTEWESSVDLVTGATYQWEATTVSPDGEEHTATGTVTTPEHNAQEELTANTIINDEATVGVGAPIVVIFNSSIPEDARAAVEARLSVDVTDEDGEPIEVEGSWGWLYDTDGLSRVHYRPQEFWPANVHVDVSLPLEGVEYSQRWYGKEDVEFGFEVGRDQRVVADAQSHRMTIERDGEQIADWPTSLGSAKAPSYNGTHVVMAKHEHYVMTSERWNYETPVSWAVRIHNNGEFIHAAPWSVGVQGNANVSHGCINLSTERAKEYFDMALYGDPVEITGSSVDLSTQDSDISDWVYSWDEWQELSALS